MLWSLLALLVVLAAFLMFLRRRAYRAGEDEPWRRSLAEGEEPLDLREIRRAEEEWLSESGWESPSEDEEWR